ncbi:hypothetical protein Y032_0006g2904 [Ancylostoma ceylanicum]|uniref:C2H2-type domain-containing protein n=1 Tax=Ancylostoma ceylanicum TaxID=53326 RepID=A0A016VPG2_9BILA|nr:hypothetical protein Y032_0006g2904 [Ancylostoma ceylanicum]
MRTLLISITICGLIDSIGGQAVPKPAIRVRLNKGVFEQASTIVAGLVEYEVPRIKVPPTQQCFPEGCVQSYPTNCFSKHRTTMHSREPPPFIHVAVLHRHHEHPLERKIMEAREIKRHHPEINSRDELTEALKLIA